MNASTIIEVIIILLFGALAIFGLILWRAPGVKDYDPTVIIEDGDFDPHHDHYSNKDVEIAVTEERINPPAKADALVKSDSMSLTEHSWLTPPELIYDEESPSGTDHREDADRRQDRRARDRRSTNDRRNENRRGNHDRRVTPIDD